MVCQSSDMTVKVAMSGGSNTVYAKMSVGLGLLKMSVVMLLQGFRYCY